MLPAVVLERDCSQNLILEKNYITLKSLIFNICINFNRSVTFSM